MTVTIRTKKMMQADLSSHRQSLESHRIRLSFFKTKKDMIFFKHFSKVMSCGSVSYCAPLESVTQNLRGQTFLCENVKGFCV